MASSYGINPSVYNGGAVPLNLSPFMNFYMQQQARKEAQNASLDKYYMDQVKSLTPTGMRAKDIEGGWANKAAEWQKFGIENKKYILNPALDRYVSLNKFNRGRTELLADTERSKQAGSLETEVGKAKLAGTMYPTISDREKMADMSKSIYDPTYKGYTANDLSVNRPPLDMNKFLTDVQMGHERKESEYRDSEIDSKRGLRTVYTNKSYSPEDIKTMADKVPFMVNQNPSAKDAFERMIESHDKLPELQMAYNKVYPGIVDTPEKAAQAFSILGIAPTTGESVKTVPYTDPELTFQRQKELVNLHGWWQEHVQTAKDKKDAASQSSYLDDTMNDLLKNAKQHAHILETKDKDGKVIHSETNYDIPAFGDIGEAAMTPGDKYSPDALRYVKKGNQGFIQPLVYQRAINADKVSVIKMKDNKPIVDMQESRKLIPLHQYRDNLGRKMFTGKILFNQLTHGGKNIAEDQNFNPEQPSPGNQIEDLRNKYKY